ncbi:MAG: hypothetical protein WC829_17940 [Hyphomicrobium sp.]|jgi:hypothetical protein
MHQFSGDTHAASHRPQQRPWRWRVPIALGFAALIGMSTTSVTAAHDPDWDQVENIRDAATRLAVLQRTQGATKAFSFIDACYRTHSLSSEYTKAFEACIAQDYLETQALRLVYSRMSPESLKRLGAPTPDMLARTMTRRVGAAFAQYKISKEQIAQFQRNVDKEFPIFLKTLFPGAQRHPEAPPLKAAPDAADQTDQPGTAPEKKP